MGDSEDDAAGLEEWAVSDLSSFERGEVWFYAKVMPDFIEGLTKGKGKDMATVTRTTIPKLTAGAAALKKKPALMQVSLPTKPSVPSHDINDYHLLLHGEKKIGKTSFATVEEGVFLMTWDPLQKSMSIMQAHLPNWQTFDAYLRALEEKVREGKYPYKRVVVDGADIMYRACQDYICRNLGVSHPSEADWGKGWDTLKETFSKAVDRLLALPGGCWFISHSDWKEVETRKKGRKITKLVPLIKAGGEEIIVGKVDGWFAYCYDEEARLLVVRGDERTGAGHRIKDHFFTPKGERVTEVPMGENEHEAYENFIKAFNNQQEVATLSAQDDGSVTEGATTTQKPALFKKPAAKPVPQLVPGKSGTTTSFFKKK